jgi:hypothetical protein
MNVYRTVMMLALIGAWLLPGCAAIQRNEAEDRQWLLAAAGFHATPAATPGQLAHLRTMPPYQMVVQSKDGRPVYTYADPDYCQCWYEGGAPEYAALARHVSIGPDFWPERRQERP